MYKGIDYNGMFYEVKPTRKPKRRKLKKSERFISYEPCVDTFWKELTSYLFKDEKSPKGFEMKYGE